MDLEADPIIVNFVFLFQIVDNDLADITPRSYVVRVSPNAIKHFLASFFWGLRTHISLHAGLWFFRWHWWHFPGKRAPKDFSQL